MIADMVQEISKKWWTFVLRGVIALLVAAYAFAAPQGMQIALVYFVGAYFLLSGVFAVYAGVFFTGVGNWWAYIIMGIISAALVSGSRAVIAAPTAMAAAT